VAGLAHDGDLLHAVHSRLSHETGTQRMAGVLSRVQPGGRGVTFHDDGNGFRAHPGENAAVPVDVAEDRARCDQRGREPLLYTRLTLPVFRPSIHSFRNSKTPSLNRHARSLKPL
jgi:hypothetical protein